MEFKPADYLELPVDLRLHLLGLPAARRRGRPRDLAFLERVRVAQAHAEALNAHAIHVHDRNRDRAVAGLQKKFRALCAAKAAPHKIAEVRAEIDKHGRVTRVAIKPPDAVLPEIDKQVAELFGITERMVRRCRTDPKLQQFMPHPVWLERDWLKQERLIFEARQVAKRLMTPERYAKGEPLTLVNGTVMVGAPVGEIIQRPAPRHRVGCEGFGIGRQPKGELASFAGSDRGTAAMPASPRRSSPIPTSTLAVRSGCCTPGMRFEESPRSLSLRPNSFRRRRGGMFGRSCRIRAGA